MQYRSFSDRPVELRDSGGGKSIVGYAATYNSLSHDLGGYREKIRPGAFDRSLREVAEGKRSVSARVQHDGGLSTVGTTANGSLRLSSDAVGLKYEITALPDTTAGRDLLALVGGGYLSKSSFAFACSDTGRKWDWATRPPTVELLDVDLIDVAPVDGPAYEATSVEMRNLIQRELGTQRRSRVEVRDLDGGETRAEIYIYDEILPTWISRYMTDTMSAGEVVEALEAAPNASAIDVYINSPGGDVFEAMTMYDTLKRHPAPVNVYVQGLAASAAALIAMAGDHIEIGDGGFMMIHNAWTGVVGSARELRATAVRLDKIDSAIAGITAARTGQEEKKIAKMMADETWFTASEAVANGFADRKGSAPIELTEADGERCRVLQYRNIPAAIGGSRAAHVSMPSTAEYREVLNRKLTFPQK